MHHIGRQAFYDDVKQQIDSLHRIGYVVYYELVTTPQSIDSSVKDTLLRKFRKIVGQYSAGGYLKKDGLLAGKKYKFLKELVNQPKDHSIGLDAAIDMNVDAFLNDLVNAYENKYSKIILEPCDFDTGLNDEYNCTKINNEAGRNFFLKDYRNDFITNRIINSPDNKIVLLYGKNHYYGILNNLLQKIPAGI